MARLNFQFQHVLRCSFPLIMLLAFHWACLGTSVFLLVENLELNPAQQAAVLLPV